MKIVALPSPFFRVARQVSSGVNPGAQERMRYLSCWHALRERNLSSTEASQVLGLRRSTLYRWRKRLNQEGPKGLEHRSRQPKRRRQPTWSLYDGDLDIPPLNQALLDRELTFNTIPPIRPWTAGPRRSSLDSATQRWSYNCLTCTERVQSIVQVMAPRYNVVVRPGQHPTKTTATDNNPSSGRFLSCLLSLLVVVVAVLGVAFFAAWLFLGGGVWRSEVRVVEAALRSPDRLTLLVASCNGDPEVSLLRETDVDVQVKVVASSTPLLGRKDCLDTVEVQLQKPLRERVVIDKHTGQSVTVSTVNSSSDQGERNSLE